MKNITLLFLAILIFTNYAFSQKRSENCFEIKYLDFFGLDKISVDIWTEKQIDELLELDYSEKYKGMFFVPFIVQSLGEFHPSCSKLTDIPRFNKLILLYSKITNLDISSLNNKSVEKKLFIIRDDFYALLKNKELLARMRYTMDDGPLYGEVPKIIPKEKLLETITTDFGKLSIFESNKQIFLIAKNKSNKMIWARAMKGINSERYLTELKFDKEPIEKTSLVTIIHFYSEGERLNLYLGPEGKFLYYYHSW